MKDMKTAAAQDLECCPTLSKEPRCDVLDFRYRLPHRTTVKRGGQASHRNRGSDPPPGLTRCPGPLSLGDPFHTITLLPGEKVKRFTSDRHPLYDRQLYECELPQRAAFRGALFHGRGAQNSMTDVSATDASHSSNSESGKWDFHDDASGSLGFFSVSADANARGSHSASSTSDFLRQMHTLGQSICAGDACGPVLFHRGSFLADARVNRIRRSLRILVPRVFQCQPSTMPSLSSFIASIRRKITLEAIKRRVDDPAAPTRVSSNPTLSKGQISVVPTSVLARKTAWRSNKWAVTASPQAPCLWDLRCRGGWIPLAGRCRVPAHLRAIVRCATQSRAEAR